MQLPLKEPLAKYVYISPDNIMHIWMPIVSGTSIGLDNTCKAVYSLQEFFGKGSNSNHKITVKGELLTYKKILEYDLSLLKANAPLTQKKQERLTQVDTYLKVVMLLENHPELDCLNKDFPDFPKPLGAMMQDRNTSNLYSMILRPTEEDGYLRSEAANPIFSVAHKNITRHNTQHVVSPLQQALIQAYTPLTYEAKDLKFQVIQQTLAQLKTSNIPIDFEYLKRVLQETVNALRHVSVDFTRTKEGTCINQQDIDTALDFNFETTTPKEYIEALLGYCAPDLFDTVIESPFKTLIQAESWSIATQFLLGITNIYCVSQKKISPDINFGQILDKNPDLSKELAETLAQAQQEQDCIEDVCISWMNTHAKTLSLNISLNPEDLTAIKEIFVTLYAQIKDSPHFDEFLILDTQQKGDFVTHQGAICTSFAKFASSSLFNLPLKLTQKMQKTYKQECILNTIIPHKSLFTQEEIEINTKTLGKAALQALHNRINTCQDSKLKEQLLNQLKRERPDFKPQIDARKFLQHVAYGEQKNAENLLKINEDTAQQLLTSSTIPFTDYSARTFTCTAYEYAYWAKDTHMCRMLEQYMDKYTQQELLDRVQKIEERTGFAFIKKPRGLAYIQNGKEYRSPHFDLSPLKQTLNIFIKTYHQSPKRTHADWVILDKLWIKVGLSQKEVPAHIAQEYCHPKRSFYEVSQNPSLLDASNPANLERQFQFLNGMAFRHQPWFTPDSYSSARSEPGFWLALFRGSKKYGLGRTIRGVELHSLNLDLSAIEVIDKIRTEDLKQSLANLSFSLKHSKCDE